MLLARFGAIAGQPISPPDDSRAIPGVLAGDVWLMATETPQGVTPEATELGFAAEDMERVRAALGDAGATNLIGPARFATAIILQAALAPGVAVEFSANPKPPAAPDTSDAE